ncbi:transcriptional regulator, LacI family [Selenomonas ruminantium]|uniref:Transcriptional regulator, LacI family n=1 Tax=Selenomonas ruminantium TaxID=971 RepID=A0A1M6SXG8_SELRU|nr:helix-turn-helix domain-containing protein [Selenomonas ruminantium]SHK49422.1 transcriptional regulator, LacI family [Selenomonas ruminantium]
MAFDRDELVEKLADALADNPGCTMKELAEAVGISKASLHRIYTNKANICQLLVEKERQVLADVSAVLKRENSDWLDDLQDIIGLFADNGPFVRCMGRETLPVQVTEAEWDAFDQELTAFFRKGREAGLLQGDFSSTDMNDIFFGLITGLIESMGMRKSSPGAVKRIVYEALLGGIYRPLTIRQ